MREEAPIEVLRQRLDNLERIQMVNNLRHERRRGVPQMLQELAERNEWIVDKILYNNHKM